jgi:hypothetical protein
MGAFDRDSSDADYPLEIGIVLHNENRRAEATPWLELAVAMEPEGTINRRALEKNLAITRGMKDASRAVDPSYIPVVDDAPLRQAARSAHHDLIKKIIDEGEIKHSEIALFDPKNLPAWIHGRFPDLA